MPTGPNTASFPPTRAATRLHLWSSRAGSSACRPAGASPVIASRPRRFPGHPSATPTPTPCPRRAARRRPGLHHLCLPHRALLQTTCATRTTWWRGASAEAEAAVTERPTTLSHRRDCAATRLRRQQSAESRSNPGRGAWSTALRHDRLRPVLRRLTRLQPTGATMIARAVTGARWGASAGATQCGTRPRRRRAPGR